MLKGPREGKVRKVERTSRTRNFDCKDRHVIGERARETRAWNRMLVLTVQGTGEVKVRELDGARHRPIRAIYTDGVGNRLPVRVDGVVLYGDGWTAEIEKHIGLRVCLTPHGKAEVVDEPEGTS